MKPAEVLRQTCATRLARRHVQGGHDVTTVIKIVTVIATAGVLRARVVAARGAPSRPRGF